MAGGKTRWIMRSTNGRKWETAQQFTPEEVNSFECSTPVSPIYNDSLTNPQPGDKGHTPGLYVCMTRGD